MGFEDYFVVRDDYLVGILLIELLGGIFSNPPRLSECHTTWKSICSHC